MYVNISIEMKRNICRIYMKGNISEPECEYIYIYRKRILLRLFRFVGVRHILVWIFNILQYLGGFFFFFRYISGPGVRFRLKFRGWILIRFWFHGFRFWFRQVLDFSARYCWKINLRNKNPLVVELYTKDELLRSDVWHLELERIQPGDYTIRAGAENHKLGFPRTFSNPYLNLFENLWKDKIWKPLQD